MAGFLTSQKSPLVRRPTGERGRKNMENIQEQYRGKGALDAFLNLLALVTMVWSAIAFGGTVFQIINKFFGEAALGYESVYRLQALQFMVASVIIVVPIFLAAIGILHKQYKLKKLNNQSGVHRWLTYLMLFVAVCNIIGSLIALVYRLLAGDYTIAFILKALTVLVIALGIFGYHFYDLRRQDYLKRSQVSIGTFSAVVVLSVIAVITAFFIVGSPQQSRALKFDAQRVNDLSNLKYQIENYYRQNKALPADLSDPQFERFLDPETKQSYDYNVVSKDQYELCATFGLDAPKDDPYTYGNDEWRFHKAGYQCYTVRVTDYSKEAPVPVR